MTNSPRIGSATIIISTLLAALLVLLCLGYSVGWDATWRSFGVTPLHPFFVDMHGVTDPAACAVKGFNPYLHTPCMPDRVYNYPPVWLWLGYLGIDGSDAVWLSILIIVGALVVVVLLLQGRSIGHGALASLAILSPSVMMGVERGNIDFLILMLVGGAALVFKAQKLDRIFWAGTLISLGVFLKLYPMFCVALVARFYKQAILFAVVLAIVSLCYLAVIFPDLPFIRQNTGTTFDLSYGYKVPFLGLDHLRSEAGLGAIALTDTWVPFALALLILILAAATALLNFRYGRSFCTVPDNVAGTAYLFGSGIYCGTFLLGANYIYRLMFLLLCLPQLLDWGSGGPSERERTETIGRGLLALVLSALWLNGNPHGFSTFMWAPQLIDWLLFFGLATILLSNLLSSAAPALKRWQPLRLFPRP
jgi:hypothetical protein